MRTSMLQNANTPHEPTPRRSRRQVCRPTLVAALLAAALAVLLVACQGGGEEVLPSHTPTATPGPSATGATVTAGGSATATPATTTQGATSGEVYRNAKRGYAVVIPPGWRVATAFMEEMAARLSSPGHQVDADDYVVITSWTDGQEQDAIEGARQATSIGLEPWFGFAAGEAIRIAPLEVIYGPDVSEADLLLDVDRAGIVRKAEDVRDVTLGSGLSVLRMTKTERDDNGHFTYDFALVRGPNIVLSVVETPDYAASAFESVVGSFKNE